MDLKVISGISLGQIHPSLGRSGGHPILCGILSSISVLYPLDASDMHTTPHQFVTKCPWMLPNIS